jgi:TolA-binding protein
VTPDWEAHIRIRLADYMELTNSWVSAVPEYRVFAAGLGTPEQRELAVRRYGAIARLFALRSLVSQTEEGISYADPRATTNQRPGAQGQRGRPTARTQTRRVDPETGRVPARRTEEDEEIAPGTRAPADLVQLGDVPPGMYLYLLAEHFAQEMGRPDSAAAHLEHLIRHHPESELVPQALFAMTEWLSENEQTRARADSAGRRLVREFPDSRWTYYYQRQRGEDPLLPADIRAEEALQRIEERIDPLAAPADWAGFIPELHAIAEEFESTRAARKAELIAAGLLELGVGSPDSAKAAYTRVVERYPGSEQARQAQQRLEPGGREVLPDAEEARRLAIEQEMRSWGTWFGTLSAAKVTRLQVRGPGVRVVTAPRPGAQARGREETVRTTRPPPRRPPPF